MRKLIAVVALSLSASAAWAQTEKATIVTKLPGEESLSLRERAERDFLMPVRRKKATAAAEHVPAATVGEQTTAAPEIDATAHYAEAAPDPRPEEVVVATETKATASHSRAARHAAWVTARRREARAEEAAAERRAEARAEARRAARHSKSSRSSKSSKAEHSTESAHHSKTKHHSSEEVSTHRSKKEHTAKATHHATVKKEKTKSKTSTAIHKKKHKR